MKCLINGYYLCEVVPAKIRQRSKDTLGLQEFINIQDSLSSIDKICFVLKPIHMSGTHILCSKAQATELPDGHKLPD